MRQLLVLALCGLALLALPADAWVAKTPVSVVRKQPEPFRFQEPAAGENSQQQASNAAESSENAEPFDENSKEHMSSATGHQHTCVDGFQCPDKLDDAVCCPGGQFCCSEKCYKQQNGQLKCGQSLEEAARERSLLAKRAFEAAEQSAAEQDLKATKRKEDAELSKLEDLKKNAAAAESAAAKELESKVNKLTADNQKLLAANKALTAKVDNFKKRTQRYSSCKEIKEKLPKAKSGVFTLKLANGQKSTVWCDMDYRGGGWTAILNPTTNGLSQTMPGWSQSVSVVSGSGTCDPAPRLEADRGWTFAKSYACGNMRIRGTYGWTNSLQAREIVFKLTMQGQNYRSLTINGRGISPPIVYTASHTCAFYTAGWKSTTFGVNQCWNTRAHPLTDEGMYIGDLLNGQNLAIVVDVGNGCQPNCSHGTGWSLYQLWVR